MRAFLSPRWLGLHLLLVVSVTAFVLVGRWQWGRGQDAAGSWQNYGYALQWWLFAGFAVFLYVKLVLDELDPASGDDDAADGGNGQLPLPPVVQRAAAPPAEGDDDELAAYNRYLQQLHDRSRR